MWKYIKPSRGCLLQTTLCQGSIKKSYFPFSNSDNCQRILGLSNYSTYSSSRNCLTLSFNNEVSPRAESFNSVFSRDNLNTSRFCSTLSHPGHAKEFICWHRLSLTKPIKPLLSDSFSIRHYAKGKDRGSKSGKGKTRIDISPEEMSTVVNGENLLLEFDEVVAVFKEELIKAVAIRTNVGNLEELQIELEGDTYSLNELAQVHRKSPTLVVINCSAFPQATKSVVAAIEASGMNLHPQQEGTSVAVPIPTVTREHREELATKAKQMYNKCKDNLRQVHNAYVRKARLKEGQVSSDTLHKVVLKIKELMDERAKEAEALLVIKQSELLKSS